jgi:hypothetical protein
LISKKTCFDKRCQNNKAERLDPVLSEFVIATCLCIEEVFFMVYGKTSSRIRFKLPQRLELHGDCALALPNNQTRRRKFMTLLCKKSVLISDNITIC